jgi:uncharacterized protein YbjT (DUF2867 family)
MSMSTVVITGASGVAGQEIIRQRPGSHAIVALSRKPRRMEDDVEWAQADLGSGGGLTEALQGSDAVVHLASDPKHSQAVDIEGTRRLAQAAQAAGVRHLLYLSITGCDRVPFAYYRAKVEAENIVRASGVPYTILRATQFHEFNDALFRRMARAPLVMPVPKRIRTQTVAVSEVADHVWRRIAAGPSAKILDFVGPAVRTWGDMLPAWRGVRGVHKPVLPLPIIGEALKAFAAGEHTDPNAPAGRITWEDWLKEERAEAYAAR